MSQQEDDLRALAKIMDFLRAVSIILVVAHLYWYCYEAIRLWGVNIGVVDRILMNFHRTAGLFGNILYTKLFHKFNACIHFSPCMLHSTGAFTKTFIDSTLSEHIHTTGTKIMPPCHSK